MPISLSLLAFTHAKHSSEAAPAHRVNAAKTQITIKTQARNNRVKSKKVLALTFVTDKVKNKHADRIISRYFKGHKIKTINMSNKYNAAIYNNQDLLENATINEIQTYKAQRGAPDFIVFFGHGGRLKITHEHKEVINFNHIFNAIDHGNEDSHGNPNAPTCAQDIILMGCNTFGNLSPQDVLALRNISIEKQWTIYGTTTKIRSSLAAGGEVHGKTMVFTPDGNVDKADLFNGTICENAAASKINTCPQDIHDNICTPPAGWGKHYTPLEDFNDEFFNHMAEFGR